MSSASGDEVVSIGRLAHCELILPCLLFCLVGGGEFQTRFQEYSYSKGSEKYISSLHC